MTMTETGQPTGPERHESALLERWFGASLTTGRSGMRTGSGEPDAHIEVRLFP